MASIQTYKLADGTEHHRVRWQEGGRNGEPQSVSFEDAAAAAFFKKAVDKNKNRWPPHYIRDVGWVDPQLLAEEKARLEREQAAEAEKARRVTFRDFVAGWLDQVAGVEPRTAATYRRQVEMHMLPSLGDLDISSPVEFGRKAVTDWIDRLFQGANPPEPDREPSPPLKTKTVKNLKGLLSSIMQAAVDAEPSLRGTNPVAKVRVNASLSRANAGPARPAALSPAGGEAASSGAAFKNAAFPPDVDDPDDEEDVEDAPAEMVFLTHSEFAILYAALDDDVKDMVEVMVGTGLRYGEITALRRMDLFLDGPDPYLMVQKAWKRQEKHVYKLGTPKTPASLRRISLSPRLVAVLRAAIVNKRGKQLVFTKANGTWWDHNAFRRWRWRPALYLATRCEACRTADGVRSKRGVARREFEPCGHEGTLPKLPRIHDLRHTHCAWMIWGKQPLPLIQARLGHASIVTTVDRYGHLVPALDAEWLVFLDAVLTGAVEAASHLPHLSLAGPGGTPSHAEHSRGRGPVPC